MKNLSHTQKQFDFENQFHSQVLTRQMMYHVRGGDGGGVSAGTEDPPLPPPPPNGL